MTGSMSSPFEMQAVNAEKLSACERERFVELVIKGSEVGGGALATNISNAKILVVIREQGVIHGVGALKRPQGTYRKKVAEKAALELDEGAYPYELGYIFFEDGLRGKGLSHDLVAEALKHSDNEGVFATVRTDNIEMRATLDRAGFASAGQTYPGSNEGTTIGVLIRPPGE